MKAITIKPEDKMVFHENSNYKSKGLTVLLSLASLPIYCNTAHTSSSLLGLIKNYQTPPIYYVVATSIITSIAFLFVIWNQKRILKEKNRALKSAKEEAEALAKVKSDFLATMSHEIRTPMNGVIGMANALSSANLNASQKENLDVLKFSANNLVILVNEILDLEKIESGKIGLEETEIDLIDFCNKGFGAFKNSVDQTSNEFVLYTNFNGLENNIIGDPHRLNQILANLASNALKFTKNGNVTVKVNVTSLNETHARVKFEMIDTGIGISKENQKLIFEKYTQAASNTTRLYGGTGLGLNIAKEIVELYGSELKVESELGKGSNFYFEINFPLGSKRQNIDKNPNQATNNAGGLVGMRILLAEDNKVNQLVVKRFMINWGAELTVAQDGLEATQLVREKDFDLILMDIQMPNLDGYEATELIRKMPGAKGNIPIIAMTASSNINAVSAKESKMDGYIGKPFDPKDLLKQIIKCGKRNEVNNPDNGQTRSASS